MFTDKCKVDFKKWQNEHYGSFGVSFYNPVSEEPEINSLTFEDYPYAFRQGVYLQFFRLKGITIIIDAAWENGQSCGYFYQIIFNGQLVFDNDREIFKYYDDCFLKSLKQADKVYNTNPA